MKTLGFVLGYAVANAALLVACGSDTSTASGGASNGGVGPDGSVTTGGAGGGASGGGGSSAGGNHPATGGSPITGGATASSGGTSGGTGGGAPATGGALGMPTCGADSPVLAGGQDTGYSKCADGITQHRRRVTACPDLRTEAAAGSCSSTDYCRSNADCSASMNGVCLSTICICAAACHTDADCGTGKICQCLATSGTCVDARFTSDADCGTGLLCASSANGFACQTPQDECLSLVCGCGLECFVESDGHRACLQRGGCDPGPPGVGGGTP